MIRCQHNLWRHYPDQEDPTKQNGFLFFGLVKRKQVDSMVVFDDKTSMESSLLWSSNSRTKPSTEEYLDLIPQHKRGIANYANVQLLIPPVDRMDY